MSAISCHMASTSGHSSFPPTNVTATQSKVFADGCALLISDDPIIPHTRLVKPFDTHSGVVQGTTGKVFIGGVKAIMIGDPVTCGDTVAKGSSKTFIK